MIHFDLPKQKSSIIKVLGVGGGGSNAVNFMFAQDIEGVDFIICNTDAKAIEQSKVPNKIQLGPHLTQGLGAGANPEVGRLATEESLDEIKRILEVNTKMAFVTAGMGGGTGTGGAPIIAKICKDLGILTVGIVTTPFGFEGPRRMLQAEEGIKELKPYVDTLLVISNDKLRMQYGNLKMKEAFGKADNVLATAAKCITDIINSRGHIIVDFADVCTVMKNGGVAILGKAEAEGENRAQNAIEEALNSPLLNDSDIKGAKWILININSAEGDHECTMDELEVINNYLRMQAGEGSDVIVGMGYDNTLDKKIGITLVATGFQHKDPFAKIEPVVKAKPVVKEEKIVMTLNLDGEVTKPLSQYQQPAEVAAQVPVIEEPVAEKLELQPTLQEEPVMQANLFSQNETKSENIPLQQENNNASPAETEETPILHFELSTELTEAPVLSNHSEQNPVAENQQIQDNISQVNITKEANSAANAVGGFLARPINIYAEPDYVKPQSETPLETQPVQPPINELPELEMTLVVKDELPETADEATPQIQQGQPTMSAEEPAMLDDADEQKRRAAERIQKLRNLSFNMNNAADPNNEFDSVPAYIRRNMELFGNTLTSVENFYSKYTVGKEENSDQTNISTLNTFLDGKKPD